MTLTARALTLATRAFPANVAVIEIAPLRGTVTTVLNLQALLTVALLWATRLVFSLASTLTLPCSRWPS